MQEFWQFAGSYWWLIFPIYGIAAGAGTGLRKLSKERHDRRLEIMAAKRELKAAGFQAPPALSPPSLNPQLPHLGAIPSPLVPPLADGLLPATRGASRGQELARIISEHDEVTARWLDYELDIAKLIAFPTMSDGRNDLTAAFLRAKRKADSLRPESATAKVDAEQVRAYREAVLDFGASFDVAERDAMRQRDRSFSPEERKRLERATQLLKVAEDQGATQAERQIAYKRVREELDGLIAVSTEALNVLQKKVAGEITTGLVPPPAPQ